VINPAVLSQVLVRTLPNGQQTFYVYGLGLIGEETNGKYRAYHYDLRGSTVALTDATGSVVEQFQYSAYAQLVSPRGTLPDTPFLYNGRDGVMMDVSGLYYMRARYYSPEVRRFVNQDILLGSIAEGQTLNRYAYVTGQPVSYVDPFGLTSVWADIWKDTLTSTAGMLLFPKSYLLYKVLSSGIEGRGCFIVCVGGKLSINTGNRDLWKNPWVPEFNINMEAYIGYRIAIGFEGGVATTLPSGTSPQGFFIRTPVGLRGNIGGVPVGGEWVPIFFPFADDDNKMNLLSGSVDLGVSLTIDDDFSLGVNVIKGGLGIFGPGIEAGYKGNIYVSPVNIAKKAKRFVSSCPVLKNTMTTTLNDAKRIKKRLERLRK
jgi:RHS repeat-associated protein